MKLNEIKPAKGAVRKAWRRGQGPGSGNGKTAGRGHKGQHSRTGSKHRAGFEGGQMPLHRRLPKRGFTNPFRKEYEVVNLSALGRFAAGSVVDAAALSGAGLVSRRAKRIKILGNGAVEHALTVKVQAFSESAKAAIEAKGGSVEVVA